MRRKLKNLTKFGENKVKDAIISGNAFYWGKKWKQTTPFAPRTKAARSVHALTYSWYLSVVQNLRHLFFVKKPYNLLLVISIVCLGRKK